jgi:CheY-like chemotaxis protein
MHPDVMVIEDDPGILDVLCSFIKRKGYGTVGACNGAEALRLLDRGGRPGLILLDLAMSGLDGWGFLDAMARRPECSATPVFVLTGDADAPTEEVLARGARGLLLKPVEPDELLALIRRYC